MSITAGDFNGDGNLDIAVLVWVYGTTNQPPQSLVITLLGNGDGSFGAPHTSTSAPFPIYVAAGDFKGDGISELAIGSDNSVSIQGAVLPLTGTATAAPGSQIAIGDFDGDGNLDLAVESIGPDWGSMLIDVFYGYGDGTFGAQQTISIPMSNGTNAYSIAAADFSGDGISDLAAYNDSVVQVFLGNRDRTFTASASIPGSTTSPDNNFLAAGDFNGDGTPDIVLADSDLNYMGIVMVQDIDTATATLTGVTVPGTGPHNVVATFDGIASSPIQLSASLLATTTTLSASSTSAVSGQQVTITASVISTESTPAGSVSFYNSSTLLGTGTLQDGVASLATTTLPLGADSLTAVYAGNTNFAGSTSSPVSVSVTKIPTTTALRTSANSAVSGTSITLTATVSAAGSTPIGSVSFYNGTTALGTVTLQSGEAALATTTLPAGSNSISADYAGSGAYASSNSASVTVTISAPVSNPRPAINSMSPAFVSAGSAAFPLTVNGANFTSTSVVFWGSAALSTQYVNGTQLIAQIPVADTAAAGTANLTVETPAPGGGTSNSLVFEIDSPSSSSNSPQFGSTMASVVAGANANYSVTLPAGATRPSVICLNLPAGATCTYSATSSGTLTVATSPTTPSGTYQITAVFTETLPGTASALIMLPILLLPLATTRRRWSRPLILLIVCVGATIAIVAVSGCGGNSAGTAPSIPTHQSTGSGTISLTVRQ